MKIVIVDPSRVVQKVLSATLEAAGHELVCYADGAAALERVKIDPLVEVLVTSLQPHGISGLDLVRSTRAHCGSRRALYILVMSSSAEQSTLIEALDSGADDFIGKPPAPEELLARLRVAERVSRLQRELIRLATIDSLTGLLNRRAFFDTASIYAHTGVNAVAICDIDTFKQINDSFGHAAGDRVIVAVTEIAARICPVVGRLGGEEFGMLMPGASVRDAVRQCEEIRRAVEALTFAEIDPALAPTCSFGAGQWRAGETIDDALKRADVALYAAKSGGRNRVVAATGAPREVATVVVRDPPDAPRRRVARPPAPALFPRLPIV